MQRRDVGRRIQGYTCIYKWHVGLGSNSRRGGREEKGAGRGEEGERREWRERERGGGGVEGGNREREGGRAG